MVLFVPELGAEERHVLPAMEFLSGASVHYYWSPDRTVMVNFGVSVDEEVALWDYWAIYSTESTWKEEVPPTPEFWQHQMAGLPEHKKLNVETFSVVVRSSLPP